MIALVLAAAVMAAVFIRWAVLNDDADAHMMHRGDCPECES